MARIFPFRAYRYSNDAGSLSDLVTQPYDKITPAMRKRYLALSPNNLVRVILGEKSDDDTAQNNVYTRAKSHFEEWMRKSILKQDSESAVYAYTQEFKVPDSNETATRKGFIALGAVEDYDAHIVHRHEQTLSGPKKDRLEVLRHTRAHFGQIFMLYPDRDHSVDHLLDQAVGTSAPVSEVTDEYQTIHRLWKLTGPSIVTRVQELMADKRLLIADGHHRYETALNFRNENPEVTDAKKVMMTFVNMYSPGLKILATHRVVSGLPNFNEEKLIQSTQAKKLESLESLKQGFATPAPDRLRIGIALQSGVYLIERPRKQDELDVPALHKDILSGVLGISEDAVREESFLQYVRGIDAAVEKIAAGAQAAFLLEPTTVDQVAAVAFSGGVMPQKSTDFYPKLLSGLTIYKIE